MDSMRAVLFKRPGSPLKLSKVPIPQPGPGQVLLKVQACGVCHTDLHILDGDLAEPKFPIILGHQIVGTVIRSGPSSGRFKVGDRIGVPWLGKTDGICKFCQQSQENLCDHPTFTGYNVDGGFAEYSVADERFCFPIPEVFSSASAAPLLCAGLIGYRAYRMAGENIRTLGIYGFGAAAHIVTQVAKYEGRQVLAFSRPGDARAQEFALHTGATWAGDSTQAPPEEMDAALIFAPVGPLVVSALQNIRKGGTVVCGGIHMSDIPAFPYRYLWEERVVRSVANLTRRDGEEFLALAPSIPVTTNATVYPLNQVAEAIHDLREGHMVGAAVISMGED